MARVKIINWMILKLLKPNLAGWNKNNTHTLFIDPIFFINANFNKNYLLFFWKTANTQKVNYFNKLFE